MTIRNREEAARAAEATVHNTPGFCQGQVHAWYLAPSVGDVDGDGAADAEDGWKSEPAHAKHLGDRNPPRGVPLSFLGGSHDNGHRAMSLGPGKYRSTDFDTASQRYRPGVVGTAKSIAALEQAMGVSYAGWSETISGIQIPLAPKPPAPTPPPPAHHDPALTSRGNRVDDSLDKLQGAAKRAPDGSTRDTLLKKAIHVLRKIKPTH